jgi:hypothetical protein
VLFLDRSHARARAYIERARCAIAERQRESDELLHSGLAAFERGDIAAARTLLSSSVQQGGPHEAAVALLGRIDRLEHQAAGAQADPSAGRAVRTRVRVPAPPSPESSPRAGRRGLFAALALIVAAGAVYGLLTTDVVERMAVLPRLQPPPSQTPPQALHVPSRALLAIERARKLFDRGHLHEALAVLDAVRETDPLRAEADAVKTAIQRVLLSSAAATRDRSSKGREPSTAGTR